MYYHTITFPGDRLHQKPPFHVRPFVLRAREDHQVLRPRLTLSHHRLVQNPPAAAAHARQAQRARQVEKAALLPRGVPRPRAQVPGHRPVPQRGRHGHQDVRRKGAEEQGGIFVPKVQVRVRCGGRLQAEPLFPGPAIVPRHPRVPLRAIYSNKRRQEHAEELQGLPGDKGAGAGEKAGHGNHPEVDRRGS